jgi:HD-like signal output (HDOD) protein
MLERRETGPVEAAHAARPPTADAPAAAQDRGQRAFRFLQEIAHELSATGVTFPTFIDATVKVRFALSDPKTNAERLARVISGEPVLAAKLVRMANSAALNPNGKPVTKVRSAVMRVGFTAVRSIAAAVALKQVRASKDLAPFADEAERRWLHSLEVAAIAHVLARERSSLDPDEALFAGLVHDIGCFYLLSRASRHPELVAHREELDAIVQEWHPPIGQAILQQLHLSEGVVAAVANHELGHYELPPHTLTDIVTAANLASHARSARRQVNGETDDEAAEPAPRLDPRIVDTLAAAEEEIDAIIKVFR